MTGVLIKGEILTQRCIREEDMRQREKMTSIRQEESPEQTLSFQSSKRTNPANALILAFQLPEQRDHTFLLLKAPVCGTLSQQPQYTLVVLKPSSPCLRRALGLRLTYVSSLTLIEIRCLKIFGMKGRVAYSGHPGLTSEMVFLGEPRRKLHGFITPEWTKEVMGHSRHLASIHGFSTGSVSW
jgi:hypothetical protein